ncbi:MAG: TRAP transporter TatT component family protein [Burkholderiales bacterium]
MRVRILATVLACCAMLGASGCSVREYALRSIGDALAGGGDVYAADEDIELVGAATPFGLKTVESLLAEVPDHRGLLLAAARGFTQYAYVYVQYPAEQAEERDVAYAYAQQARARRLYLRARDYGLRGLGLSGDAALLRLQTEPGKALAATTRDDVPLLYWAGVAWAAAISLSKDSPATIAGLPAVDALIARAAALDIDYDRGSLRTFLIGYEMSRPNAGAGAESRARTHFARAVELSAGRHAGPYVSLAESVAVEKRNRREFEALLKQAIEVDPGARPEWRLANLVMQRRARQLLARTEELFPE